MGRSVKERPKPHHRNQVKAIASTTIGITIPIERRKDFPPGSLVSMARESFISNLTIYHGPLDEPNTVKKTS